MKSSLAKTTPTQSKKTMEMERGNRDFPERRASTAMLDLHAELLEW